MKMTRRKFVEFMMWGMENGELCCICGRPIVGWGNNPDPVVSIVENEKVRCCDDCDAKYVLPARLAQIQKGESREKIVEQDV